MALIYQRGIDSSCKFRFRNLLAPGPVWNSSNECVSPITTCKWVGINVLNENNRSLSIGPHLFPSWPPIASRLYDTEAEQRNQTALSWKLTLQLTFRLFGSLNLELPWVRTECLERNYYCMITFEYEKLSSPLEGSCRTTGEGLDEPQPKCVYGNKCTVHTLVHVTWITENLSELLHNINGKCVLALICKLWLHPLEKHFVADTTWDTEMFDFFNTQLCGFVFTRD